MNIYPQTVNIGGTEKDVYSTSTLITLDELNLYLNDITFNKVQTVHECNNGFYLVGLLNNNKRQLAIYCSTRAIDLMAFNHCKNYLKQDTKLPVAITTNMQTPELEYMSIMMSSGYNLVQELNYFLIKNPVWHWVKYVVETEERDDSGDSYYKVILNRLISEQELEHFKRVILSTGLDCHIYGERYD